MRASLWVVLSVGALGALTQIPAFAQDDRGYRPPSDEAIIYRDAAYLGPAVNVSSTQANLGLAWPVNSIRVRSGRWELCERAQFRGKCRTVDADTPMMGNLLRGIAIQSMRPLDSNGSGGGSGGGSVPADNRSLRGMAGEFYPQPGRRGQRIPACDRGSATANCAARTADDFCETMNYRGSASQTMETVRGREYLADVLCTRTGY